MKKTKSFDISEYLDSQEMMAEYLNSIMEEENPDLLLAAIGDIAKAKGMHQIAQESGLGRESLYKALTAGAKPRFQTVIKVLRVLGLELKMKPSVV